MPSFRQNSSAGAFPNPQSAGDGDTDHERWLIQSRVFARNAAERWANSCQTKESRSQLRSRNVAQPVLGSNIGGQVGSLSENTTRHTFSWVNYEDRTVDAEPRAATAETETIGEATTEAAEKENAKGGDKDQQPSAVGELSTYFFMIDILITNSSGRSGCC